MMDTAVRQRTLVYPNTQPVYWTTPFAKVAPYVYREWTSATTVELSPYCAWKPILCDDRNTVVVWLVVQQVMALAPEVSGELKASIADGLERKPGWKALEKVKAWLEL